MNLILMRIHALQKQSNIGNIKQKRNINEDAGCMIGRRCRRSIIYLHCSWALGVLERYPFFGEATRGNSSLMESTSFNNLTIGCWVTWDSPFVTTMVNNVGLASQAESPSEPGCLPSWGNTGMFPCFSRSGWGKLPEWSPALVQVPFEPSFCIWLLFTALTTTPWGSKIFNSREFPHHPHCWFQKKKTP